MTTRRTALLAGATLPLTALLARGQTPGTAPAQPAAPAGEDPLLAACLLIRSRK